MNSSSGACQPIFGSGAKLGAAASSAAATHAPPAQMTITAYLPNCRYRTIGWDSNQHREQYSVASADCKQACQGSPAAQPHPFTTGRGEPPLAIQLSCS